MIYIKNDFLHQNKERSPYVSSVEVTGFWSLIEKLN